MPLLNQPSGPDAIISSQGVVPRKDSSKLGGGTATASNPVGVEETH